MDTEHSPAGNTWCLKAPFGVGGFAAYLGVPVSIVYDWCTRPSVRARTASASPS